MLYIPSQASKKYADTSVPHTLQIKENYPISMNYPIDFELNHVVKKIKHAIEHFHCGKLNVFLFGVDFEILC